MGRRERIAPKAVRAISASPFQRERRLRRLRQRIRTKVVTGNRSFSSREDDSGEGGEEVENGFKIFHFLID